MKRRVFAGRVGGTFGCVARNVVLRGLHLELEPRPTAPTSPTVKLVGEGCLTVEQLFDCFRKDLEIDLLHHQDAGMLMVESHARLHSSHAL